MNPDYYLPLIPNERRRAPWHDYRSACVYMITLNKAKGIPVFSSVCCRGEDVNSAFTRKTALGETISKNLRQLPRQYPFVSVIHQVIMPEHIHFILYVKATTEILLGELVSAFKGSCTRDYANGQSDPASMFEEGYHDRILMKKGQLDKMRQYISDNPRRRLLRMRNPEFHRRFFLTSAGGGQLEAYGNADLLSDCDIEAVRVSRSFSADELNRRKLNWKMTVENGGVLVSPFISASEKKVRDWALENDGRIIRLERNGFGENYHPKGIEHAVCSEGRLLIIAPATHSSAPGEITRAECMIMNGLAEEIAAGEIKFEG